MVGVSAALTSDLRCVEVRTQPFSTCPREKWPRAQTCFGFWVLKTSSSNNRKLVPTRHNLEVGAPRPSGRHIGIYMPVRQMFRHCFQPTSQTRLLSPKSHKSQKSQKNHGWRVLSMLEPGGVRAFMFLDQCGVCEDPPEVIVKRIPMSWVHLILETVFHPGPIRTFKLFA